MEDKYVAALLNAAEMVRKGCTAAYDLYFEFPVPTVDGMAAVGRAYAEVGVRTVVAPMMADRSLYEAVPGLLDALPKHLRKGVERLRAAPFEESIKRAEAILKTWPFDQSTIRPALAPTIPLHCSDPFLIACRDLAGEHGARVHMHLAESKVQAVAGLGCYGKTLTAHLDEIGLLGPQFTGAHGIWLDDEDIRRLADRGASIAHNPGSNLRLGSGIAPVRAMLECQLTVGVGSDGSVSSDNQNLFEAMRLASFVSRVQSPDYETWLSTEEAVGLGTTGGARVLGFGDEIGRIAPGCYADIVFLDLTGVNLVPLNDVTNQLVHCEDGSSVDSVMIGGRMVLQGGRFTHLHYARLLSEVEQSVERLRAATAEMKDLSLALEAIVGRHCIGLARQLYSVSRLCGGAASGCG
jgi:cytosine/adenosine deaminase-related metal-dependent hydrolase